MFVCHRNSPAPARSRSPTRTASKSPPGSHIPTEPRKSGDSPCRSCGRATSHRPLRHANSSTRQDGCRPGRSLDFNEMKTECPVSSAKPANSPRVTGKRPTANGFRIVTLCWGPSRLKNSAASGYSLQRASISASPCPSGTRQRDQPPSPGTRAPQHLGNQVRSRPRIQI